MRATILAVACSVLLLPACAKATPKEPKPRTRPWKEGHVLIAGSSDQRIAAATTDKPVKPNWRLTLEPPCHPNAPCTVILSPGRPRLVTKAHLTQYRGEPACPTVRWELWFRPPSDDPAIPVAPRIVQRSTRQSDCGPGQVGEIDPMPITVPQGSWTLTAELYVLGEKVKTINRDLEAH